MTWDPLGTIGNARWICGGRWAGRTTVAGILARRYGLTVYRHHYPASRSHLDRAAAAQARAGEPVTGSDPDWAFVPRNPQAMAAEALAEFADRFEWALDDLRALESPHPAIAEGRGMRPELVAGVGGAGRMVVLVPTESAVRHGVPVIEVDGGRDANGVADLVAGPLGLA